MKVPVAIVGGGPAGAAAAMFLAQHGIACAIVERDEFPRYHIGESMSGECGALVRRLGLEAEMGKHNFPIKRGLTVYGTGGRNAWFVPVMGRDDGWNLFPQTTWQVRRADFDKLMLDAAVARGATLIRGEAVRPIRGAGGEVRGLVVRTADAEAPIEIESEVLLDCSGQGTFLAHHGVTGPKYSGNYDKQVAIFSQVAGAARDDGPNRDDTLIFYKKKYHWSWFIPLDGEVVSVGVVAPAAYFKESRENRAAYLARELQELNPEMARRIGEPKLVEATRSIPNYSFQVQDFCGKGFICVGDSHRFIDPIFSFGLYVSVKEARDAAEAVARYLAGEGRDDVNPFAAHQLRTEQGIDILEDMMDTFWEFPLAFAQMVHRTHPEETLDIFAGRLYERQPSACVSAMRGLLKRERRYDEFNYSVPIGSRYRPERAPIWQAQEAEHEPGSA